MKGAPKGSFLLSALQSEDNRPLVKTWYDLLLPFTRWNIDSQDLEADQAAGPTWSVYPLEAGISKSLIQSIQWFVATTAC